jgi:hypothetical protein
MGIVKAAALTACILAWSMLPARADNLTEVLELSSLSPCTVVAVQMVDSVDSSTAQPGDFFRFETINAVTVGNKIVIPARTMGYGIVAVASPAGRGGRAGTLVLEPRYLELPDHEHLGVVLDHNASDLQKNGKSGNMPGYLGAIPVPAIGAAIGIFNYFHRGHDILVKKGEIFSIFPADGPKTERCQEHPDL